MSKNNKKKNLNNVSNSNIKIEEPNIDVTKIIAETSKDPHKNDSEYKIFCDKYINADFSQYKLQKLKEMYEIANGLLNQYFIIRNNKYDNIIVMQLQYIVSSIMYNINIKQTHNYSQQNNSLNKKLESTIKRAEKLENDAEKRTKELEHVKNDMKSITTTIISIILAISIIPTAIAGIEKINPNYILPFVSSVILFGMIMIIFVYSIYQNKIKLSTKVLLTITVIFCISLWILSFYFNISKISNIELENKQEINNQIQENVIKE